MAPVVAAVVGWAGAPGAAHPADAAARVRPGAPVVWVQAGHQAPREPGYLDQTGASGGPFGSELAFTARTAAALVARLRAAGVDARETPGLVTPDASRGADLLSIHMDARGGSAAVGYAVTGGGENWYHGEGTGTASQRPYPDSARHRPAQRVTATVERRSRALAERVAAALSAARRRVGGASSPFLGVIGPSGNTRVAHYYAFYRTRAQARVIVECGAAGADDRFLARTAPLTAALSGAIVADLRGRGLLPTR